MDGRVPLLRSPAHHCRFLVLAVAAFLLGPAAGVSAGQAHTCLWKVTGDHNTVYLLGSVHMLPPNAWPLPTPMQRAFDRASRVIFEADLGDTVHAGFLMLQRAALPGSSTLSSLMPPRLHRRLVAAIARAGGDPRSLEHVKPWFAAMTLTTLELQTSGYRAEDGIDLRLWNRAVQSGKRTGGLETLAHQIEILDSFTMKEQIELLHQTLDEIDRIAPDLGTLTRLWRTGQAGKLAETLRSTFAHAPGAYRKLVVERNRDWLPKIEAMTHGDRDVLVVVGVLHLVGPGGIVEGLRSHGLLVIQE